MTKIAIEKEDLIIFLGDYIDKGLHSKEVLDTLLDLKSKKKQCRFFKRKSRRTLVKGI